MALLDRWDLRNQRIVIRQNERERERNEEWEKTHFVVTGDAGVRLTIWAKPSGHPFRFVDGAILPVFLLVGIFRNKYQFLGGWTVGVLAPGRVLTQKILRLERHGSKEEAQVAAKELARQLSSSNTS